jgi:hypothetical protein
MKFLFYGPPIEKFWNRVHKTDTCYEWIAFKDRDGYGVMRWERRHLKAHRISWEIHFGLIPKGKFVLHRCNNPACVHPDHLYLGTQPENRAYCVQCNRQAKGKDQGLSKLTERDVLEIRDMPGTTREIGSIYGISSPQVSNIKRRVQWKHLV